MIQQDMVKNDNISAIILAAGLSARMGRFKPLMELGDQTVTERVISVFGSTGIGDICVVIGHRASEMRDMLVSCGVRIEENRDYQSGMYSSVVTGVKSLPSDCRAFLIHPVDIPLIRPQTVSRVLSAYHETSGKIFYPTFDGRRGHPPLVDAALKQTILDGNGKGGLRALLARHNTLAVDVPVMDEAILFDFDTPKDYHFMLTWLANEDIPTLD